MVVLRLAERGVRVSAVRLAPTVHGPGDHGFIKTLVDIARDKGVSGYIGEGLNRWPAVHRLDAGSLFRLTLEKAPAGSVVHGVADEGVPARTIAEIIGRKMGLPVASISPEVAGAHFDWQGRFFAMDQPASSELTLVRKGWKPTHPWIVEELETGHYTVRGPSMPSRGARRSIRPLRTTALLCSVSCEENTSVSVPPAARFASACSCSEAAVAFSSFR